jgi:hypothetical protein
MPTPPLDAEQIREIKLENLQLRGQIIGSLEVMQQMHQTSLEVIQARLDRERTIVRLLTRDDVGTITPEEAAQLEELRKVEHEKPLVTH